MSHLFRTITAVLLLALPTLASATTWKIDPDHSNIGFKVKHLMVSNVKGTFDKFSGVVTVDDRDITKSKVEVTIDPASINTRVEQRDTHLKSADFFDVAKYPTMTFVSKKVAKAGRSKLNVTGDLTMHGITREVVLSVEGPSPASRDPWGGTRRGATATATVNRKDFGLTWNKALETGGVLIGDEVTINLEIEMVRQ